MCCVAKLYNHNGTALTPVQRAVAAPFLRVRMPSVAHCIGTSCCSGVWRLGALAFTSRPHTLHTQANVDTKRCVCIYIYVYINPRLQSRPQWYGICERCPSCNHGQCDDSVDGNGCICDRGWPGATCTICAPRFAGAKCDSCTRGWNIEHSCNTCAVGFTSTKCDRLHSGTLRPQLHA